MLKLMGKKIFTVLHSNILLTSEPVVDMFPVLVLQTCTNQVANYKDIDVQTGLHLCCSYATKSGFLATKSIYKQVMSEDRYWWSSRVNHRDYSCSSDCQRSSPVKVNQSQPSIQNIQVSGNSKFTLEEKNQSTMVRPQIWSGFSSETRHAQCIKPERVLLHYGTTKGTGL